MPRPKFGVAASEPRLVEAATAALERSGTAVDACIAAFFAAAASSASVLFGAVTLMTAGPGVGARCFDGPLLQPGKGAPRPRGFRESDEIPIAATLAVSSALVVLYSAHAHDGARSWADLVSSASKAARALGMKARAALLDRIAERGPLALRDSTFVRDIVEVGGRAARGCITERDLTEPSTVVTPPELRGSVLQPPQVERTPYPVALEVMSVCVCDARGILAAMNISHDPGGVPVPRWQISLARCAVPVRRGVPRVKPAAAIGGPAPVALLVDDSGVPWCAVAFESTLSVPLERLGMDRLSGLTLDQTLQTLLGEPFAARRAYAVLRPQSASGQVLPLTVQRP